jgi:hypothetical protein
MRDYIQAPDNFPDTGGEYETQKIFGFDEAFANCGYENIPRWSQAEAA